MKYNALSSQGIEIGERLDIPDELIPDDAHVEMEAKKAAGYFTNAEAKDETELRTIKGRNFVK